MRRAATPLIVLAGVFWLGPPALAEEKSEDRLRKVEESLDKTRSLSVDLTRRADRYAKELRALKSRMVVVAGNAQDREAKITDLERAIHNLRTQRTKKTLRLADRREKLALLVAALQRMAQHPPVALIALPAAPADTVRSAILLRGTLPRLEHEAEELRAELAGISALGREIAARRDLLGKAGKALARERRNLAALIARKAKLERRTRDRMIAARTRAEELAAEARDLRELLARLAEQRKKRAAEKTQPNENRGTPVVSVPLTRRNSRDWLFPARGRIVRNFGEKSSTGSRAKGVTIETRPDAQIVAPRAGAVVFAGPFRGYGELLIIEYDKGYHVLLSGMSRIDTAVGDEVLAGEPIGVMTRENGGKPKLYLELRRKGVPVNPLPWLAATRNKVSG